MLRTNARNNARVQQAAFLCATLALIALMTFAKSATATPLCSDIKALIELAREGSLAKFKQSNGGGERSLQVLNDQSSCDVALQPDGESYFCYWQHPFRAASASTAFQRFNKEIQGCIEHRDPGQRDQDVNHPDSYQARHYALDGARVAVSLKDKAQLRSTFVFIRVSADHSP